MSKTTRSRGHTISYEDAGRGDAVVLIPGFLMSVGSFRSAGYIERLAERRRVLALDPLGHGKSDKPHDAAPYRSPAVCADVIAVMDAESIDRAVLWGYSRGAWLAMMAAIEFPDRVNGVLVGGSSFGPPPAEMPGWVEPLKSGDWSGFWKLFPMRLDDQTRAQMESANDPQAMAAERVGRIESAYKFDLTRVSEPVLIYCGSEDGPADCEPDAEALATTVCVIQGRDHGGAFRDIDQVMRYAIPFLDAVAMSRI